MLARVNPQYCIAVPGWKGARTLALKNGVGHSTAVCAAVGVAVECAVFKPVVTNYGGKAAYDSTFKAIHFCPLEGEGDRITNLILQVFDLPMANFGTVRRTFMGDDGKKRSMDTWQMKTLPTKVDNDMSASPSKTPSKLRTCILTLV